MRNRRALRKISVITLMLVLMISFQNCGKFSLSAAPGDLSPASSGTPGAPTGTTGSTGSTPTDTVTPIKLSATERTAACYAALSSSGPVLKSFSLSNIEVKSGLGITNSGDSNSAQGTAAFTLNVGNPAPFADASLACEGLISASLKCEIDTVTLNKAIDFNGIDVSKTLTADKDKIATVQKSIGLNDCRVQMDASRTNWLNPTAATIKTNQIKPNSTNATGYRCVDATFNLKISVRVERSDTRAGYDSNVQSVPFRIKNNCANETALKPGGDLPTLAYYGGSVAIDGNWAAVVATQENAPSDNPIEIGAAYLYFFDGSAWVFKQKIQLAGAAAKDTISAVALKGSNLILASAYNNGTGSVTLFQLSGSTWQQIGPVTTPSDGQAGQNFGAALALEGTTLAVGAPLYNTNSGTVPMAGAVSVYDVTSGGLVLKQVLIAGDSIANRGFGSSIAISGTTLAIGAPQAKTKESSGIGEVYIFQKTTSWTLTKNIANTGLDKGSRFGASVDLNGSSLVIGIPGKSTATVFNTGQVDYYADWNSATKVSFAGTGANDYYGSAVKVTSDKIFIGAPFRNSSMGQIDVRMKAATTNLKVIRPISAANNDRFGSAIAINGNNVVVGAYAKKDPQISSGAAFLYLVPAF